MTWTRTFDAPAPGIYQVVLPFQPGEWQDDSARAGDLAAFPYSWHPGGEVRRVLAVVEAQASGFQEITLASLGGYPASELPAPPNVEIRQLAQGDQWNFSTPSSSGWITVGGSSLAARLLRTRLTNDHGNLCDFGVSVHEMFWKGARVLLEIRLTGCQPDHPIETNWPIWGGVWLDGSEMMLEVNREVIGDRMCIWHRDVSLRYAVCDQWAGHASGGNGVDYTKVLGGSSSNLIAGAAWRRTRAWWEAGFWHPNMGRSTGIHGDFGVADPDVADAVRSRLNSDEVLRSLHVLCEEYLNSPYHLLKSDGQILEQTLDYPRSWSIQLGEQNGDYPHYGKVQNANSPDTRGRSSEDNSHVRSNSLACIMEFAPTPMYSEEVVGFRHQALLNMHGGEERAFGRVGATCLEILPFVAPRDRTGLLDLISSRMRFVIQVAKDAGYRSWREEGPQDRWIPDKVVFFPWQMSLMFGHFWAAHLSGYEALRLTDDEVNTVKLTATWLVDNTWRKNPNGSWNHAYASAVDLSEHSWGGGGISLQGVAGLEPVAADSERAKEILAVMSFGPFYRWYPQRPDPAQAPETMMFTRKEVQDHVDYLQQRLNEDVR